MTCFPPGKVVATATKGGNAGVVHEVYDSLFFSSNFLFPLEGKCHVVAKGCTGQSTEVTLHHYPDRQSAAPRAKRCTANTFCTSELDRSSVPLRFGESVLFALIDGLHKGG